MPKARDECERTVSVLCGVLVPAAVLGRSGTVVEYNVSSQRKETCRTRNRHRENGAAFCQLLAAARNVVASETPARAPAPLTLIYNAAICRAP